MPFSSLHPYRVLRLPQILAAVGLSAAALLPPAFAQTAPSFTAGPDDVMRVLPSHLLPALQIDCHGVKIAAPAWPAQLDASAARRRGVHLRGQRAQPLGRTRHG